jgi:hypothetical protein
MAMETRFTPQVLDDIAWRIDRHGIGSIPSSTLRDLGLAASRADASAVLIAVMADDGEPPVARARAFGHLAALLSSGRARRSKNAAAAAARVAA